MAGHLVKYFIKKLNYYKKYQGVAPWWAVFMENDDRIWWLSSSDNYKMARDYLNNLRNGGSYTSLDGPVEILKVEKNVYKFWDRINPRWLEIEFL